MAGKQVRFLITVSPRLVARIEAMANKRRAEIRRDGGGKFFRNDMVAELLEEAVEARRARERAAKAPAA